MQAFTVRIGNNEICPRWIHSTPATIAAIDCAKASWMTISKNEPAVEKSIIYGTYDDHSEGNDPGLAEIVYSPSIE